MTQELNRIEIDLVPLTLFFPAHIGRLGRWRRALRSGCRRMVNQGQILPLRKGANFELGDHTLCLFVPNQGA